MRKSKFALAAAAGAVSLYALNAIAQQQNTPPAKQPPAAAAPDKPAATQPSTPSDTARESPGAGNQDGRRWGRRDGEWRRGPRMGLRAQRWRNMSEADRKAFFEARIAAVKAGLMLNETQTRLWPAVEQAMREMVAKRRAWRERIRKEGRPANPIDRMKRRGDFLAERGAALQKYADAAKPLYETLSDEQKRRLRILTRGFGPRGIRRGRHGIGRHGWRRGGGRGWHGRGGHHRHGWRGQGDWRRHGQHHHGWNRGGDGDDRGDWRGRGRGPGRGMMDGQGPRWQRQGQFNQRWSQDRGDDWAPRWRQSYDGDEGFSRDGVMRNWLRM